MAERRIDWRLIEDEWDRLPPPAREKALEDAHLRYARPVDHMSGGSTGREYPGPDERSAAEIAQSLGPPATAQKVADAVRRDEERRAEQGGG